MLIQVHYPDNRFDYVKDHTLQRLIEARKIARFRRSGGWVTVGVDPVRQFERNYKRFPATVHKSIVRVAYTDNRYDYVSDKVLDMLIESREIIKFKRVTGWVMLGVDPLRRASRQHTYRYPTEQKKRVP